MRGDETQSDETSDGAARGPRHAAPRRSFLSKIHVPAGKAMALAAMPTAVLVGMGLAPRLALADDKQEIPFAPGPCVTRSDEPTATPGATKSPEPTASATATPGTPATTAPSPTATASGEPAPGATTDTAVPAGQRATAPATPTPTPTPTKSVDPLDPLGVGDALKDLFDIPGKAAAPTATTPSPGATAAPNATPDKATSDEPAVGTGGGSDSGTADEATGANKAATDAAADAAKDAIKDAAGQVGATTEELPDSAKGLDTTADTDIPDGAKPRFPCPEPDPEALAAADLEPGLALLPDDPWILQSTLLNLTGLDYKGIVEVKTGSGKIKKVLKFTADSIDIKDLHQLTVGPDGTTGHVKSRPGSTSTIRNGEVTMYTEELKGNLFGLIPVTFSPETPPPLNVPWAFFTNVKVTQAGQFGGTLTIPGLENYLEPGTS
ncbi:hypothetical protein [Streptomyces laurentii]|uniref:hypothetical protein n=1 Tax=Streptomyces laurentii TaxID=39478 RepID=UPI0036A787E7